MSCPVCHITHNGECHKCTHGPEVSAGKWKDIEFAQTPCASCGLSDAPSHDGQTFVSIDARTPIAAPDTFADDEHRLAVFLREFFRLDAEARDVVAYRFRYHAGEREFTFARIGELMCGVTKQATEQRLRRAIAVLPELAFLLPDKSAGDDAPPTRRAMVAHITRRVDERIAKRAEAVRSRELDLYRAELDKTRALLRTAADLLRSAPQTGAIKRLLDRVA